MQVFANAQIEFTGIAAASRGGGEGLAVFFVNFQYFVQYLANFFVNFNFVITVDSAKTYTWKAPDVALVFF